MAKKRKKKDHGNLSKQKVQNLVAKHSRNMTGAGAHTDKTGEKAPRVRQKREWKKGLNMLESIQETLDDPFEQAIREVEKEFDINLAEGSCGAEEEEFDAHGLSDDQMRSLVDFVHDELLHGAPASPENVEDAIHTALDDVSGFETGDRDNVVGRMVSLYNQMYGRE